MERRRILAESAMATVHGIAADGCAIWADQTVRGERELLDVVKLFAQLDELAAIRRDNGVDSPEAEAIALEGALDVFCDIALPEREFRQLLV